MIKEPTICDLFMNKKIINGHKKTHTQQIYQKVKNLRKRYDFL